MDTYKTHGAFSWSELMTNDPQAAANFYSQLFGWKVDTMPMGEGQYRRRDGTARAPRALL